MLMLLLYTSKTLCGSVISSGADNEATVPSLYEHEKMEQSTPKGNSPGPYPDRLDCYTYRAPGDSGRSVTARAKSL